MISIEFLRQYRIFGYATFDLLLAFVGMAVLSPFLSKLFLRFGVIIPKRNWVYLALPLGIVTHLLFGSITPMTAQFFNPSDHYLLKIVILVFTFLGLRGIKGKES